MKNPSLYALPLKVIEVSSDLAVLACILGNRVDGFEVVEGVPQESAVVDARYENDVLYLVVSHESFPLVETGAEIPTMTVTATKIPVDAVVHRARELRQIEAAWRKQMDSLPKHGGDDAFRESLASAHHDYLTEKTAAETALFAAVDEAAPLPALREEWKKQLDAMPKEGEYDVRMTGPPDFRLEATPVAERDAAAAKEKESDQ